MQRLVYSSVLVLGAALALWAFQAETRPSSIRSWEYAIVQNWRYISGSTIPEGDRLRREYRGGVTICYVQQSGCKLEEVELALSFLEDRGGQGHWGDVAQAAVAKALTALGTAGWELVGNGPDPNLTWQRDSNVPSGPIHLALYLKRPKQ
jgi:hypothetical protein